MQAFQNLLNLHILFCPSQDSEAEDSPLSLTLDEEVQLRCAALVQAEVERFVDEVVVHSDTSDGSDDEGASGGDDTTAKKRKSKKVNGARATTSAGASIRTFVYLDL
jgi:cohesin complex subunit SA-1/2